MATAVVHTLGPGTEGYDYSLMSVWEATEQRDLVTLDETETLECYAFDGPLADNCVVTGWDDGPLNSIQIVAAAGSEATKFGVGFEMTFTAVSFNTATLVIYEPYTTVKSIGLISSGAEPALYLSNAGSSILIDSCVLSNTGTGAASRTSTYSTHTYRNCLMRSDGAAASVFIPAVTDGGSGTMVVDSCTFIRNTMSGAAMIRYGSGSALEYKNCVAYGAGGLCWGDNSAAEFSNNNASSDSTAKGDDPQWNITEDDFENYAEGDYRPAAGGLLDGAGADLSADFTTDIVGSNRTVPWAIGAYITYDQNPVHTLKAEGGDYSLMSTWESTEQRDLVALGETETLECYNDWPEGLNDACLLASWVTGTNNKLTITAAEGSEATAEGVGFRMISNPSASNTGTLRTAQSNFTIKNIGLISTSTQPALYTPSAAAGQVIDGCVLIATGSAQAGRFINAAYPTYQNCLFKSYGTASTAFSCGTTQFASGNCAFYNCHFIKPVSSSLPAISGGSSSKLYVRNCVAYAEGGVCFGDSASATRCSNNASNDETAKGVNPQWNITEDAFTNYGADYSPASGGPLDGTGMNLSGNFTTDITGATRTVPWTIGAYITGDAPVGVKNWSVNVGGVWKKAQPYMYMEGAWKPVSAFVLHDGAWLPVYED